MQVVAKKSNNVLIFFFTIIGIITITIKGWLLFLVLLGGHIIYLIRNIIPIIKDERVVILNRNNHTNQNQIFSSPDTP